MTALLLANFAASFKLFSLTLISLPCSKQARAVSYSLRHSYTLPRLSNELQYNLGLSNFLKILLHSRAYFRDVS